MPNARGTFALPQPVRTGRLHVIPELPGGFVTRTVRPRLRRGGPSDGRAGYSGSRWVTARVLDGAALARRRAPLLAQRAAAVRERRGRPPALVIVAFSDSNDRVPHVRNKVRQCAEAGVEVTPLIFPSAVHTERAVSQLNDVVADGGHDGVFLQFPFSAAIDGDKLAASIPADLDVDIMTPLRTAEYMNGISKLPPLTVSATLMLLDEYEVSTEGRRGIVIADESPFTLMFRAALVLRGADMDALVPPESPRLAERVRAADLVIAAAAVPGLLQSAVLSPGTVAIDAGYFNPDGRGDIDLSGGIDHLAAVSPVPGGIGPMTISALVERVVAFAEAD